MFLKEQQLYCCSFNAIRIFFKTYVLYQIKYKKSAFRGFLKTPVCRQIWESAIFNDRQTLPEGFASFP